LSPPIKNAVPIAERSLEQATADISRLGTENRRVAWMRLLWQERSLLGRTAVIGLILSLLVAILVPVRYESTTRLMPPDQQSGSGLAMIAALAGRGSGGSSGGGVA
jgi:hypothetical protein